MPFRDPVTAQIAAFVTEIGLEIRTVELTGENFLPGLRIEGSVILVDEAQLLYPGDILHEAGHLAVMTPEDRRTTGEHAGEDAGFEMAAIAWSYAAALHIGIDPLIVFHANGYKGGGANIVENFRKGQFFGVPLLQWMEMTAEPRQAEKLGRPPFPQMRKWLRDEPAQGDGQSL
ncbi:hypothetical protein Acid345_1191 [Candidatus Koribacter versatilis Ellin345]|uniref:Uncharacterized protein n=1 Tax=Koribacter versatilis (strain Ellin345) TaxID=204669 RepID=Q1ISF6_KORVE|nr:hypothetical protein [Candidatus Koribacter versatilis]ABF40194.1 hypothetical protein Acid345_1191 [Candidatus Koribacter versatilis Ellin345]